MEQIRSPGLCSIVIGLVFVTPTTSRLHVSAEPQQSWIRSSDSMTALQKAPFLSKHEFVTACEDLIQYIAAATEKDYWASAAVQHENVC